MSTIMERVRAAAAAATEYQEKQGAEDTEARRITDIMERFLRAKKRVIYGGAAINAQLPAADKFYDPQLYLPDYDFMTPTPIQDCEDLMTEFRADGFKEVESKLGIHEGTYKVFVNFRSAADITFIPLEIYKRILKDCRVVNRLFYASPNWLRMNTYLELSRPAGMVMRWEKVYQRLLLLNKTYPLHACTPKKHRPVLQSDLQQQIVDEGIAEGAIFLTVRGLQKPKEMEPIVLMMTDKAAALSSSLRELGLAETRFEMQGELLPARSEFRSEGTLTCVVFATVACHAYTQVGPLRLASLDLLIQMYYALYFMELRSYVPNSILCTIQRLMDLEAKRRANPSIPLEEAFPLACVGHQPTMPELKRAHRARLLEYTKKAKAKAKAKRKTMKTMKTTKATKAPQPVVTLTQ
jgi:hypothetical protein